MKENTNQSNHDARHSLPWLVSLSWIIYPNTNITQSSKHEPSMVKQTNSTPHWRYPFIVVYQRLAYLLVMFYALLLKFNPPRRMMAFSSKLPKIIKYDRK